MALTPLTGADSHSRGYSVGILTVSDRCHRKEKEDLSGPVLRNLIYEHKCFLLREDIKSRIVPDEKDKIEEVLVTWADELHLDIIFTIGGTGFSLRDVTPEATEAVIHRRAYAVTQALIASCSAKTSWAFLSRATCGIRGSTMILNFPGSVKATTECFLKVVDILPHALDQLKGYHDAVEKAHLSAQLELSVVRRKSKVDVSKVAMRPRASPFAMIETTDALEIILRTCEVCVVHTQKKKYNECVGYISASDVRAVHPSPPYRASMKDGYAVLAADGSGLRKVIGALLPGMEGWFSLLHGTCMRVSTGGTLPMNADAVVQVEDTYITEKSAKGDFEIEIFVTKGPVHGADIREIGCDIPVGQVIIPAGKCLTPVDCGTLCAAGVEEVNVRCFPRVAVLSTGDELVDGSGGVYPGCVFDCNRPTLLALLKEMNVRSFDAGIARDFPDAIKEKFEIAFQNADIVLTTGGVSMGEKDYTKKVLEVDFSAHLHFGRVLMKPGKPTTYATVMYHGERKLVFCLPGNPVSAIVTFHIFVVPCLRKVVGLKTVCQQIIKAELMEDVSLDDRPEFHRVSVMWNEQGKPIVSSTGVQLSSRLLSLRDANGLMVLPARGRENEKIPKGSFVSVLMLNTFAP